MIHAKCLVTLQNLMLTLDAIITGTQELSHGTWDLGGMSLK
jgi:hypothetical protein